jgi:hypothetical protein
MHESVSIKAARLAVDCCSNVRGRRVRLQLEPNGEWSRFCVHRPIPDDESVKAGQEVVLQLVASQAVSLCRRAHHNPVYALGATGIRRLDATLPLCRPSVGSFDDGES